MPHASPLDLTRSHDGAIPPITRALFDLDETLLQSHEPYLRAKEMVIAALRLQWPNMTAAHFLETLEPIEQARVPVLGFTAERFAGSLLLAAQALARAHGSDLGAEAAAQIEAAGQIVPTWDYQPYPEALETLAQLRQRGVRLGLCTKASNAEFQTSKIRRWGLDALCDAIHIVPRKGPAEVADALAALGSGPPGATDVMVGDSLRDDISSGERLGMQTVWVRHLQPATREVRVWAYDQLTDTVRPTLTVESLHPVAPWITATLRSARVAPSPRAFSRGDGASRTP